jgi:hypothetical protein
MLRFLSLRDPVEMRRDQRIVIGLAPARVTAPALRLQILIEILEPLLPGHRLDRVRERDQAFGLAPLPRLEDDGEPARRDLVELPGV